MRSKIKYLIIGGWICTVFSCDFLDTKVDTDLTQEILDQNRNIFTGLANAYYVPMQTGFYDLDGNFFAAASDEAQRTQESGATYYYNDGTISPDNVTDATSTYRQYYEGIRAANYFIDVANERGYEMLAMNRDTINEAYWYERDVKNLGWQIAEAHVARAYYYSELIKRFGGVPIVEDYISRDKSPGYQEQKGYDQVVEYIVSEIDKALELGLQESWRNDPDNYSTMDGRFEVKSALAVKSRALLYAASPRNNPNNDIGKWERAAKAAHDVIEHMSYSMPADRDYRSYFLGNNPTESDESIFLIRRNAENGPESSNYPVATPGGNSGVTPTHNLVSSYEYIGTPDPADPYAKRDPRLEATVVVNGSYWNGRIIDESPGGTDDMSRANASKTGYYLKKFLQDDLNLTQGASEVHVWVVFRYAEILLNYAEAMNRAYGPDAVPAGFSMSARAALTEVRNSASTNLPAVTVTDPGLFEQAVKHERRVELAFEDHRYWDLLRWNDASTVLNKPIEGVLVGKGSSGYTYTVRNVATRTFHDRNYYLPFPRAEVGNSNGTLKQNQGY